MKYEGVPQQMNSLYGGAMQMPPQTQQYQELAGMMNPQMPEVRNPNGHSPLRTRSGSMERTSSSKLVRTGQTTNPALQRQPLMPSMMVPSQVPRGLPADRPLVGNDGSITNPQMQLMELSRLEYLKQMHKMQNNQQTMPNAFALGQPSPFAAKFASMAQRPTS